MNTIALDALRNNKSVDAPSDIVDSNLFDENQETSKLTNKNDESLEDEVAPIA